MRDEYARRSPPDHRAAAAAWYRSPTGRRFVELARSARKADPPALSAFAAALQRRPPSPGRLELIERYDWASGTSETSADLVLAVAGPSTARIQEGHLTVLHVICDLVESALVASEPPASR